MSPTLARPSRQNSYSRHNFSRFAIPNTLRHCATGSPMVNPTTPHKTRCTDT